MIVNLRNDQKEYAGLMEDKEENLKTRRKEVEKKSEREKKSKLRFDEIRISVYVQIILIFGSTEEKRKKQNKKIIERQL